MDDMDHAGEFAYTYITEGSTFHHIDAHVVTSRRSAHRSHGKEFIADLGHAGSCMFVSYEVVL